MLIQLDGRAKHFKFLENLKFIVWEILKYILVIRRVCRQTLGLGLGQSKDIVVVFY